MSESNIPEQPPLMSAVKARNVARLYKGLADGLRRDGLTAMANNAERDSHWWMAYAQALAQIPPGRIDREGGV